METMLNSLVKTLIMEAVDDKVKKQFVTRILGAASLPFVPKDPESVRKLVALMVDMADVSPVNANNIHTAYTAWIVKWYLDGKIPIHLNSVQPDEDNIKEKLAIFDKCRKTRTKITLKEWPIEEDQWKVQSYSPVDLTKLLLGVNSGEIEINEEGSDELDLEKFMTDTSSSGEQDVAIKKAYVKRCLTTNSFLKYRHDGIEIYYIPGGPSLGTEKNTTALKRSAVAWHTLGAGSGWCVADGDVYSNIYGMQYIHSSDVLVCTVNGSPYFSLQYEGHLRIRNPADDDIVDENLEEIPLGNFTLLVIKQDQVNRLKKSDQEIVNLLARLYPYLDLSESVTFANKQLVLVETTGDNQENITQAIYTKIKQEGYGSLKEYVLHIYPTICKIIWAKDYYLASPVSHSKIDKELAGVDEYVVPDIVQLFIQTTGNAAYYYIISLLFRYRNVIESDILQKHSGNLAAIYLKILSDVVPRVQQLSNTEEFDDLDPTFFMQRKK